MRWFNLKITKSLSGHLVLVFITIGNCSNPCERYKQWACKDKNSITCHEAMQAIPEMAVSECIERLAILKSGEFDKK